jgi:hypothetical protein
MTTTVRSSREIEGKGRTIRELLAGSKYSIDYYQREYKWQKTQVSELLDDLADKFLDSHQEGNERSAVADYGHYFLGSIIVSNKEGQKFVIDGQQRLTTLTLLLIFLHHQIEDSEHKGQIADLIFAQNTASGRSTSTSPTAPPAWKLCTGARTSRMARCRSPSPTSSAASATSWSSFPRRSATKRCPTLRIGWSRMSTWSRSRPTRTAMPTRSSKP